MGWEEQLLARVQADRVARQEREQMTMKPTVGRIVHYVSYGSPGGEYKSVCRAAIVTAVPEGALPSLGDSENVEEWDSGDVVCDLAVFTPQGSFHNRCPQEEHTNASGNHTAATWHWPERVE